MLGEYCSHNPLYPPYLKGDIRGKDLIIRNMKRPLIFERELAGKTELLRF
jgi:hypothetical protein